MLNRIAYHAVPLFNVLGDDKNFGGTARRAILANRTRLVVTGRQQTDCHAKTQKMTRFHSLHFLIFSFCPALILLFFKLFHFLMSLGVQLYFLPIEERVSPFLTVCVRVDAVEELDLDDLVDFSALVC